MKTQFLQSSDIPGPDQDIPTKGPGQVPETPPGYPSEVPTPGQDMPIEMPPDNPGMPPLTD